MTIVIRNIKESRQIFDIRSSTGDFFHVNNGKTTIMAEDEQKLFRQTNFVVGYAGTDIRLSSWADKMRRGLTNINLDMPVHKLREYLWILLNTDFSLLDRKQKRDMGYWQLEQYRSIAETSKQNDITLWVLSSHDIQSAELFKRFFVYLASL
ncbi:MAG: hypothetical protein EAZ73_09175 [Oscillatoriales cyanobacterium]|uniref:hypothetical protein n=1 Tax=unclassified Microcoleus TaxID=2642155 RepID=UPI001DCCBAB3|nr:MULTISPECIES: hypothetical protein [unclassified Microcoleus]TAF00854.1 MAG: hypothetical protein EAZ79_01420 [Oscillatoriales cyanobacterium]MCC3459808.1 hypothetical protein [Microcoleus sp. PH2017_11_PCY_U_A]MCC3478242.1 hypothetical protein [Microcoleus sp. PH2017_12_PCY_D_A]TAF21387.1 MAG: hypothetical protein EAZ73_09175 [Oscillatoriales cyanobacterium]TAF39686.1 MAG: hypothetical protein EAZ69_00170 [Oscillatoriales cyanobacterium]